ncbi:MAG: prepilin-type N-terminal cleavage/methylation domain-containing protein [Phycisphaerae bacterium]|nr:prepilin-type N-terminal cleavage/methylation domain-containing protein [Phycisphaerae bacterium]
MRTRRLQRRRRHGFTLIEAALATVIIGVGVLAMIQAQQAFHQKNMWSTNAGIAMRLGNEIRELTLNLPRFDPVVGSDSWGPEENEDGLADFDDLDDFDGDEGGGTVFSAALGNGPINARREVIPDMVGWSQTVTVQAVDPMDITTESGDANTHATEYLRIEVIVHYQGATDPEPVEMTRVSWISRK